MSDSELLCNYFKAAAKEAEINILVLEDVIKIMGWDKK